MAIFSRKLAMKILVAVDGSRYTKKMLAFLSTHSETFGANAQYTILNVQAPLPYRAEQVAGREAVEKWREEETSKVLEPIRKFLSRHEIFFTTKVVVGVAGERIASIAQSGKYDMVVMGSHGHTTVGTVLLGSVAQRVLSNCSVPVLLIR
jgi:nucleotide-binding universal stress UspA family protein